MKKLLLFTSLFYSLCAHGQDTLTADYINKLVKKTEDQLQFLIMERKDTLIYDEGDSLQKGPALSVHTEYYFNLTTRHMEKIMERASYRNVITELTVYYWLGQPIKMTTSQWENRKTKVDFDVFFMNDCFIHFTKRSNNQGKPDGDAYIRWCYDLLNSYKPGSYLMED